MSLRGVLPTNRLSLLKYFALSVNVILACLMSVFWAGGLLMFFYSPQHVNLFRMVEKSLLYMPIHSAIIMCATISIPMLLITKNFDTDRNCRIVSSSYLAIFITSIVVFVSI